MKTYKIKVNGKDYKIDIESISDNKAEVLCNDKRYDVLFEESGPKTKTPVISRKAAVPTPSSVSKTNRQSSGVTANAIKAPIPGLITQILVNVGDVVASGDLVAKMEAMKMENNILSTGDGKIKSIDIKVGDSVLEGDVLIELEEA